MVHTGVNDLSNPLSPSYTSDSVICSPRYRDIGCHEPCFSIISAFRGSLSVKEIALVVFALWEHSI